MADPPGADRIREVERLVETIRAWACGREDVRAVATVGSWARGAADADSDLDVVLLTDEPSRYVESEEWARELGGTAVIKTQPWGVLTERRLLMPSGLEVEIGVGPASWASTDPIDEGTARVVAMALIPVHDPGRLLDRLADALGSRG